MVNLRHSIHVVSRLLIASLLLSAAHGGLAYYWWSNHSQWLQSTIYSFGFTGAWFIVWAQQGTIWGRVVRGLTIILLYDINYTFASFYGRFVSMNELKLAQNNSIWELLASLSLYFNWGALLCAVFMAILWDTLSQRYVLLVSYRKRLMLLIALVVGLGVTKLSFNGYSLVDPISDYIGAFAQTTVRRVAEPFAPRITRLPAPSPKDTAPSYDIIYIIGESLRADRFLPDRYSRNVTPYLQSLRLPVVRFTNVTSHGDCTGRSVPYLMVEPQRPLHQQLYRQPTLFDYAHQAGFETSFIYSNENDWHEFIDGHIDHLSRNMELRDGSGDWTFNDDRGMLPIIATRANASGHQFLVIESYTSHWPYADRYRHCKTCRIYRPDNQGEPMPFADRYRTPITNSYDNALLYFDAFFKDLVHSLSKPTLIIFTSDHAESIDDEGRWGHCSGGPEQMSVPLMLIATDPTVAKAAHFDQLASSQQTPVSHAQLFSTILTWLGYTTDQWKGHYPTSLLTLEPAGVTDRVVLTSEVGNGADPVTFTHLDIHQHITHLESTVPNDTKP